MTWPVPGTWPADTLERAGTRLAQYFDALSSNSTLEVSK